MLWPGLGLWFEHTKEKDAGRQHAITPTEICIPCGRARGKRREEATAGAAAANNQRSGNLVTLALRD